jgi:hypothetical protein
LAKYLTLCSVYSFGLFPGVWCLITNVSEHCVCSIFIGEWISTSPKFRNTVSVPSSQAGGYPLDRRFGTDTVFRNVGYQTPHAGEQLKRLHTTFRTRLKLEIKNTEPFARSKALGIYKHPLPA